jgi:hypothetical protein
VARVNLSHIIVARLSFCVNVDTRLGWQLNEHINNLKYRFKKSLQSFYVNKLKPYALALLRRQAAIGKVHIGGVTTLQFLSFRKCLNY